MQHALPGPNLPRYSSTFCTNCFILVYLMLGCSLSDLVGSGATGWGADRDTANDMLRGVVSTSSCELLVFLDVDASALQCGKDSVCLSIKCNTMHACSPAALVLKYLSVGQTAPYIARPAAVQFAC